MTGEDLKAMRVKLGLNQEQFWARIKVTQSGGSRFENGRKINAQIEACLQLAYGTVAEAKTVISVLRRVGKKEVILRR